MWKLTSDQCIIFNGYHTKQIQKSIWGQATNIKILIFFLLVRKWDKDADTIAYKICLKKHIFVCVC